MNLTTEFNRYPNPEKDQIHYDFGKVENMDSIKIFKVTGTLVFESFSKMKLLDIFAYEVEWYTVQIWNEKE